VAVRFNSSLDYYRTTLGLGPQTAYSFCCWVKISSDRNTWVTALNLHGGASSNSATFESSSNGTTWEFLTDNGGDLPLIEGTVGTWVFLAAAVNGSSVNTYAKTLGGSITNPGSATQSELDVDAEEFWLGEWPDGGQWLNGCLTGVKLWLGAALTQAEFDTESTQLMPVRTANLTAAYPLEVAETTDHSGNGHTLSSSGTPTTEAGPTGIPLTAGPQTVTGTAAVTPGGVSVTAAGLRRTAGTATVTLGALDVRVSGPAVPGVATVTLGALSVVAVGAIIHPSPGQVFDLSAWHLTLPTEDPGPDTDAAQIDQPQLATYTDANFFTDADGLMTCVAPVQGATTSGASGATRCELRQHDKDDYANTAFNPNTAGRYQLTVTTRADATSITGGSNPRKEAIIGQIHGAGDSPIPLILAAEYHVATPRVRVFKNGPSEPTNPNAVVGITPTTDITYRIRVENDRLKLWVVIGQVADLPPLSSPHYDWPISDFTDQSGWYFKAGIYNKTTIASGSSGQSVAKISFIEVLEPGDPDPSGIVTGTSLVSLGALSVDVTGRRRTAGTAVVSLPELTTVATGTVIAEVVTGAAEVPLGALTVTAVGIVRHPVTGSAAAPLGALSVTGVGLRTTYGEAAAILGALEVVAVGKQTITGTAAVSLDGVSVTAVGTVVAEVVAGSAQVVLAGLVITADGSRASSGSVVVTLPELIVVAVGFARMPSLRAGEPTVVPGLVAGTPAARGGLTTTPSVVRGPSAGTPVVS
jgi:hypothetical protein